MKQLHKKFTDYQAKELIYRYLAKEIERSYIEEILGIKRRRFYQLVKNIGIIQKAFHLSIKEKMSREKYQRILKIIL